LIGNGCGNARDEAGYTNAYASAATPATSAKG
jgi:hypothetical protein